MSISSIFNELDLIQNGEAATSYLQVGVSENDVVKEQKETYVSAASILLAEKKKETEEDITGVTLLSSPKFQSSIYMDQIANSSVNAPTHWKSKASFTSSLNSKKAKSKAVKAVSQSKKSRMRQEKAENYALKQSTKQRKKVKNI
jgi:hypothetical protein